jgi:hypothetical protein
MRSVLIFVFFITSTSASWADVEVENRILVTYLFRFSQLTEWTIHLPIFTYCIYEDTHFSQFLKDSYIGKKLKNLEIEVQTITEESNLDNCQVIYFYHDFSMNLLKQIHQKQILSIGSQSNIIEYGIIYIFKEDQKIRFFINHANATSVGLKISSQMLLLSRPPQ